MHYRQTWCVEVRLEQVFYINIYIYITHICWTWNMKNSIENVFIHVCIKYIPYRGKEFMIISMIISNKWLSMVVVSYGTLFFPSEKRGGGSAALILEICVGITVNIKNLWIYGNEFSYGWDCLNQINKCWMNSFMWSEES